MSRQYVQTLSLVDDPELIDFYTDAHRPGRIWPEITAGIKEVGILDMQIYRLGTQLVMVMETPDDFDFDSAMSRLATLPRQQEWEEHVGRAQQCSPSDTSAGKWKMMQRIFKL